MAGNIFLDLGTIQGESTDAKHQGEIDVLAWSWGVANSSTVTGTGKVSMSPIKIIKSFDAATNDLILAAALGQFIPQAVLTATRQLPGGDEVDYLTVTLDNVLVTKVAHGGNAGEDGVAETITLDFAKVNLSYRKYDTKGGYTTETVCFDKLKNSKC